MDQKSIEKLLDDMISEAGKSAIDEMTKEDLKHLEDAYPYEISKEHEKKMKKIIRDAGWVKQDNKCSVNNSADVNDNMSEKPPHNITRISTSKKFLIIAVAATLVFALAIGGVGAWRENFVNYFLDVKGEYSDVKDNRFSNEYKIDDVYFKYIPIEYELNNKKIDDNSKMLGFINDKQKFIIIEFQNNSFGYKVNTESGDISEVILNNKDMVYFEREDFKFLEWRERDKIITVYTNDTKELLLKVVENIYFLDESSQEK